MNRKINLVWIHSHFLYWMGGTKFVHHIAKEFKKSNKFNKVFVVVENSSEFSKDKFAELGVIFKSLNSLTSTSPFYWIFLPYFIYLDVNNIKKMFKEYNLNNKNTIIISGMFPMNVVAFFLNQKHFQNCYEPFAFFYDNNFNSQFSFPKRLFIKFIALIYAPLDKWATKKADIVFTLNDTTQKMIKRIYNVRSIKTQAGVDSQLFRPYVSTKIKNKYKGLRLAIHSTDYSPVKGTDLVIKAYAIASKKIKNTKLLITTTILDNDREMKLKNLCKNLGIEKKVEFLGFLPIIELPQYYSIANVMVQGAYSESSGTTSMSLPIKEAMCCETPAIRPDTGGEDVEDGKTGFLLDPRNTALLAKKMITLLENSSLSKKMGKKARSFISNKYTWENTAETFLKSCH